MMKDDIGPYKAEYKKEPLYVPVLVYPMQSKTRPEIAIDETTILEMKATI